MESDLFSRQQTDVLRGMAAIVIAVFHVLIQWHCHRVVNLPGSVAVAMFLVLSGFGLNESYKRSGLKDYWRKRLRRVIFPYWLFLAVVTLLQGFPGWKTFLLDACFIKSDYWFVPFLVQWYLVYWIVQRWFSSGLVPILMVLGLIVLNFHSQVEAEQAFSFLAGILISQHIETLRSKQRAYWLRAAIGCFLLATAFLLLKEIPAVHAQKGTAFYNHILFFIKLPMALSLLLLPMFFAPLCRSRILRLAGIASLEIYLVHFPLFPHVEKTLLSFSLFIVAVTVLVFIFYQINHRLIARWL